MCKKRYKVSFSTQPVQKKFSTKHSRQNQLVHDQWYHQTKRFLEFYQKIRTFDFFGVFRENFLLELQKNKEIQPNLPPPNWSPTGNEGWWTRDDPSEKWK